MMLGNINSLRGLADDESEGDADNGPEVSSLASASKEGQSKTDEGKGTAAAGAKGRKKDTTAHETDEITLTDEMTKAQRVWRKAVYSLQSSFTELTPTCDELLNGARGHADNVHLKNAFQLCDTRAGFAKSCMQESSMSLEKLIKDCREPPPIEVASASGQGDVALGAGVQAVPTSATAPPLTKAVRMTFEEFCQTITESSEKECESRAEAKWKEMQEGSTVRDNAGPEGALRLEVQVPDPQEVLDANASDVHVAAASAASAVAPGTPKTAPQELHPGHSKGSPACKPLQTSPQSAAKVVVFRSTCFSLSYLEFLETCWYILTSQTLELSRPCSLWYIIIQTWAMQCQRVPSEATHILSQPYCDVLLRPACMTMALTLISIPLFCALQQHGTAGVNDICPRRH
jgi:hypothetical protein